MTPEQPSQVDARRSDRDPSVDRLAATLRDALGYARERDYVGWDYGDGMSSRVRQWLPVDSKWVNVAFQEAVKRCPVNVRPLLLVEQRRSYQGAALFALTNLRCDALSRTAAWPDPGTDVDYRREAADLVEWLVDERCEGYSGFCGGHRHEIQHLRGSKGVPNDPDVVSTSYAVRALLAARGVDERYPEIARTAADFVVEDLDYREVDDGARIDYHLNHDPDVFTVNAGALGARLLLDLYADTGEDEFRERGTRILDHVAGLQTDAGGWYYRDPPDSSHLSMDNHHNGFVIEAFLHHRAATGSDRFERTLADAIAFYREELFEPDGAPNFDESSAFPRDVHASAQGAIVFTRAGDLAFAERILEWAVDHFGTGDGRFHYRTFRHHRKRHVLMRWCQAWMVYALSEYLVTALDPEVTP